MVFIAGLMAVGFMAACGGPETPAGKEVSAQYVNCADCLHELRACLRWAGSNQESIELCQETHDACYAEMCGGLSSTQEDSGQVHAAEWCHRCDMTFDFCMENAYTNEEKTQCGIERTECYEAGQCPTRHVASVVTTPQSLTEDEVNRCYVICDGGPNAGGWRDLGQLPDRWFCLNEAETVCDAAHGGFGRYRHNGKLYEFAGAVD
ncbi:hypothetical protein [Corallococcus exercitus]|uniref:Uncharacterized protein n=1 Tax=Corallococcus exercitus TaxID=2316736 RepID=A0A7Y4JNS7_9BACT|nr:hypothetical protein [Corallococcus exercitus]NOK07462.1 hypothetical protein [Corallococcus exercitus]